MANLKEQERWEDGIYQIEENDPVLGGAEGITNKPAKQLANRTAWLKKMFSLVSKKATPKGLTATSENSADETGHTHAIDKASLTVSGVVQLNSATNSTSETQAATPKAVKTVKDQLDSVQRNQANYIPNSKKSNAVDSASADTVATSVAVKTAYDKGVEAKKAADNAQNTANSAVTKADAAQRTANDGVAKANAAQTSANNAQRAADSAQRTANDGVAKANAAQTSANNAQNSANAANNNANGRVPKTGDTTIVGALRAQHPNLNNGAWSNWQLATKQGVWQWEAHPDSHDPANRRFNMFFRDNAGNTKYLNFPVIGDGQTVAYQSWVNAQLGNYVRKAGDTMTGPLTIEHNHSVVYGKRAGVLKYAMGLRNPTSDDLVLIRYLGNNVISLLESHVHFNKYLDTPGLYLREGDYSGINFFNASGRYVRAEGNGHNDSTMMTFVYREANGSNLNTVRVPKKNGTVALLEDMRNVVRKDYSRTNKGTATDVAGATNQSFTTTGTVITYPDGRIVQIFHLKAVRLMWFARELVATGGYHGEGHRTAHVPLWTAMPNKIISVQPQIIRTTVSPSQVYSSEAAEWLCAWRLYNSLTEKNAVNIDLARKSGSTDEQVDLYIVVEGY